MTFDQAIPIILWHEVGNSKNGGYINHPNDIGGETKWGITKRSYPYLDIKNLTKDQAIAIYKRDFWDKRNLNDYPFLTRLMVFDMTVNMGSTGSGKVLQRALNRLGHSFQGTGTVGPKTMAALKTTPAKDLLYWMAIERINYYNAIVIRNNTQVIFLKGWTARAIDIMMKSQTGAVTILLDQPKIKSVPARWAV